MVEKPRRRYPHLALLTFVLILIASGATSIVTHRVIAHQEQQLLTERTNDLQVVASTAIGSVTSIMTPIVRAIRVDPNGDSFLDAANAAVAQKQFLYVAHITLDGDKATILEATGDGPPKGAVPAEVVAASRLAAPVPSKITLTPVINRNGQQRIGFAFQSTTVATGQIIYAESPVNPNGSKGSIGGDSFKDVNFAIYVGANPDPANLIFSTTDTKFHEPIQTRVNNLNTNSPFYIESAAKSGLIGSLAFNLPYISLGAGLLTAILASILVATLQRRRDYAVALVKERTEALQQSMEKLERRSKTDEILQQVSLDVVSSPNVHVALDAFYRVIKDIVPVDRVVLLVEEDDHLVVLTSAGPIADAMPPGFIVPIKLAELHKTGPNASLQQPDAQRLTPAQAGLHSGITLPISLVGSTRGLISVASSQENAYRGEDIPVLEAIGRATGAVFSQIVLLERERDATLRLQELDQLKNEFVGIVAHDLRSPMTVIAGFADLLRKRGDRISEDDKHEYLERISTNIHHLSELVEDVLQVARIESDELTCEIEPFDLGETIRQTTSELFSTGSKREYKVEIPADLPLALGDEQRQWQILMNLLSNAAKFSPDDQKIEVTASHKDGMINLSVRDHGTGVNAEDIPKLFQKFSRVPQPGGGKVSGTGLGLYIARSLVEAQGGTIEATSVVGEGSTFTYTVPAVAEVPA